MLVADDGRSAGLISGGCLESDLRERSARVREGGTPLLVTYDSTSREDILWGLGVGCSGVAHVLLERISGGEASEVLEFIELCRRERRAGAVASLYAGPGPEAAPASRVYMTEGGKPTGDLLPGPVQESLATACAAAIAAERSSHRSVPLAGGSAEAFIEYIAPPLSLLVFGAGPDAVPLVRLAKELGWHVTVLDGRAAYLTRESFPLADELVLAHPGEIRDRFTVPRRSAAVVMTHNFNNDAALVGALLQSAASFVGLLGPRAKTELLLAHIAEEGIIPTEEEIARLHAPVGLDIGAETPEEIALAIVAEIQASLHDREGTPLRRREGPIHR